MARRKQNKRKLEEIVASDDDSSEDEVENIDEEKDEEITTETNNQDIGDNDRNNEDQSLHNSILFDFRNSKNVIQCSKEIDAIRKLKNDHTIRMLKEKLIATILIQVKELMKDNFNEKLMKKFEGYLKDNLKHRKIHGNTQFFIQKDSSKEMNLLFFESLEEIAQGWIKTGLEGVVNEPVQCLMTGSNGKTMKFESSFIIIYAKNSLGKKFAFKYLICKNTDSSAWSFVGGKKSRPSESGMECCLREMREELYGYSINAEKSVMNGPFTKFETNFIYAHEVEWDRTDAIVENLMKNYKKLKENNELMTFNAVEISRTISQQDNFLDSLLNLLKKYEFTEEICDYKFIDSIDLCKEKGGRSSFLKKLHTKFVTKISKTLKQKKTKKKKVKKNVKKKKK
ncbi:predicted protein [Naegleria gruberi]|uniref:Predicted protein n=1 Tax=Naegleria gruberi TaxID=5762 RepID=D2VJZ0_NAEGR|nr:uncharacterized protein NAEGRDRAFT_69210 [Naegleria gruberi]EFC42853.1 predicted protein [Naegleria gruberi]|eukprot:XP_002675597.1 predicted protein [Naegleria gruberi strain NEG-M]